MAKKVDYPILVRLEDICPTLDRQKFDIFKAFFDETGIKPLLCVIPENRDPKLVKDLCGFTHHRQIRIASHYYSNLCHSSSLMRNVR